MAGFGCATAPPLPVCITLPSPLGGVYGSRSGGGLRHLATAEAGQTPSSTQSLPAVDGILTIVMIFLVALGFLPDYGPMKKAEERARTTGKVVADGSTPMLSRELRQHQAQGGLQVQPHSALPDPT